MEVSNQEDFWNAAAKVETEKDPKEVLEELQIIEQALEKNPPYRFGPRTIDLDLLLYGEDTVNELNLIIPHPRMETRRFVLEPLLELIEPAKLHPVLGKSWKDLFTEVEDQRSEKIDFLL